MRRVLEDNRAAFATGKFPAVNKREPVRVELKEGMLPHYEPPPKAGPAKKEYLYKQMLYQEGTPRRTGEQTALTMVLPVAHCVQGRTGR